MSHEIWSRGTLPVGCFLMYKCYHDSIFFVEALYVCVCVDLKDLSDRESAELLSF